MDLLRRISWILSFALLLSCSEQEGGITVPADNTDETSSNIESSPDDTCQTDRQFVANQAWPQVLSQP